VTPEHLPEDWRGYASVDTILWLDAKASDVRSQTQIDAIAAWVAAGGRLVVARSSEVGLAGTPLAELLPVAVRGARELPELSGLAALARSAPSGRALVLEAAPGPRGAVLAAQDGLALAVGADRGLGRVIFTGLDPAREPFSSWKDAPRFWQALLPTHARPARPDPMSGMATGRWQPRPPDSIGEMPIAQLAGQFPDVAPPAIGGLFVLIVAYLIVVGPFDYFLLRKLKKLELTWITFPAYVAGFTLLILVAGGAFIERAAYQRELTVEDHLADAGLVRSRTLSSVLAPRGILYTLRDAEPISSNYLISNLHAGGSLELGTPVLRRDEGMLLERWSVPRGATALVAADRALPAPALAFRLSGADDASVTVDVRNPTGEQLFAASLVTPKGVYELPPILPGNASVRGLFRHPTVDAWIDTLPAAPMPDPEIGYYGGRDPSGGQSVETLDLHARQALLRCTFLARAPSGFAETLDLRRVREARRPILVAWARPSKSAVSFAPAPDRLSGVRMIRAFEEPK
jgi:hypothetical protein